MLAQKLFKNGNSIVVTIPREYLKELNLRDGSEVLMQQDSDSESIVISKKIGKKTSQKITPEFFDWLESFNEKYGPALKELARK